jgi:DNA repair exonuclease SbcCD ATPase subunit
VRGVTPAAFLPNRLKIYLAQLTGWAPFLQMTFRTRVLFLALLPVLGPAAGLAQAVTPDSPLPRLLAERKVLTRQYAEANAQRHGLLGLSNKPSKKDLQDVVDALQGIVDKDEQIVAALNQTTQQAQTTAAQLQTTTATLQNTSRDDRNLTAERLQELQNEQQNLQERLHQATEKQRTLQADLHEAQQGHTVRDALVVGLALACLGLIFWRRRR